MRTNQVIPAEAVEAAAKGIWEARPMERVYEEGSANYGAAKPWADIKQYQRDRCMTLARFALEAAAPYMLADILEDAANTAETDELTTAAEVIYDLRRHAKDLRPMLNNEGEK